MIRTRENHCDVVYKIFVSCRDFVKGYWIDNRGPIRLKQKHRKRQLIFFITNQSEITRRCKGLSMKDQTYVAI